MPSAFHETLTTAVFKIRLLMSKACPGAHHDQSIIQPIDAYRRLRRVIEASALASLPFLSEESQTIYTWFLVGPSS
jgi:hypothetical protein